MQRTDTVVIGAGQAGLAASHELMQRGVEHVVLERDRIGAAWASRWDSFCLVTPNWSVLLPGYPYDGDDPDGFMPRDEIVAYLERYAAHFGCPLRTGVTVTGVGKTGEGFDIATDGGAIRARNLIVSTGAYQKPVVPKGIETLPPHIRAMDVSDFANGSALPPGRVLIIGSGQTGCQLAEELHEEGRDVILACGRAPWSPRRIGDRDVVWWLLESGFMDADASQLPEAARLFANILATGHGGGHDMHYRTLDAMGVHLTGRFLGADGTTARFAPDLADSVAWGDERYLQLREVFRTFAAERGLPAPDMPDPDPWTTAGVEDIDLTDVGTALYTSGFRPDYASWLPWPDAFDADGFPLQKEGVSTVVEGLHFVGLHMMRKRKSALLCGVGEDAGVVAAAVAAR